MALDSINLAEWIDANRDSLKPPVGNKLLYGDGEFQVMIVAGPNTRRDFHCEPGEELFYQLKGDITLKVIEDGAPRDLYIREGEIFLLPAETVHSPRRPIDTIGLVVETQCNYFEPLEFPQMVEAGLRVAHLGRSSVRYEVGLFAEGAPLSAAAGHFVHVYVDRASRRPIPLPSALLAALQPLQSPA